MCGIVGFAGLRIEPETFEAMNATMAHRGPDDRGLWFSPGNDVGLAQTRLAVIDLSPGGHQPMHDATGTIHITFNGEIYNYRELRRELLDLGHAFHTASDTEVILEAYREWGADFVKRIVGMFALALYDQPRRRVYLARDRAGEKPLFFWHTSAGLAFASELKALFRYDAFPRRLNAGALEHYLAFGYVPQELCLVAGTRKLAPGHLLSYDLDSGAVGVRRYWDLPEFDTATRPSAGELVEELDRLLLESVRRQMIADVPIGVLLSGGVDSSVVTAMAARISSRPVKTFTISFPGHQAHDEAPYARMVAEHFGTDHTEMPAEAASVSLLPQLARQYDEPIGDSSMVPTYIVARLIRRHATVALGGDGGDELFGGYPQYLWMSRMAVVERLVPHPLRRVVSRAASGLPPGVRGRNYLIAVGKNGFDSLTRVSLYFDSEWRDRILAARGNGEPTPDEMRLRLAAGAHSALQAMQRIDFRSYMVDDILVKVDRASMLASLETRAPFLDPSVIEFAFGKVPDRLKVTMNERKVLLRRLAERLLPPQLDLRRKQGFSIPLDTWFQGEWGAFMREVLSQADPAIFDRAGIADLLQRQERFRNQTHRIFALTMFELWRREYRVG
jgi:asparagine synthase (glutamine-hydrolysing)